MDMDMIKGLRDRLPKSKVPDESPEERIRQKKKITLAEGQRIRKSGGKLLVDVSVPPWSNGSRRFYTTERISYDPVSEIIGYGYRSCDGYKQELPFYGLPVYMKFNGWRKCDYTRGFTDQFGRPCPEDNEYSIP